MVNTRTQYFWDFLLDRCSGQSYGQVMKQARLFWDRLQNIN